MQQRKKGNHLLDCINEREASCHQEPPEVLNPALKCLQYKEDFDMLWIRNSAIRLFGLFEHWACHWDEKWHCWYLFIKQRQQKVDCQSKAFSHPSLGAGLLLAWIELIFLILGNLVLCFGFSIMMLITYQCFCCSSVVLKISQGVLHCPCSASEQRHKKWGSITQTADLKWSKGFLIHKTSSPVCWWGGVSCELLGDWWGW